MISIGQNQNIYFNCVANTFKNSIMLFVNWYPEVACGAVKSLARRRTLVFGKVPAQLPGCRSRRGRLITSACPESQGTDPQSRSVYHNRDGHGFEPKINRKTWHMDSRFTAVTALTCLVAAPTSSAYNPRSHFPLHSAANDQSEGDRHRPFDGEGGAGELWPWRGHA